MVTNVIKNNDQDKLKDLSTTKNIKEDENKINSKSSSVMENFNSLITPSNIEQVSSYSDSEEKDFQPILDSVIASIKEDKDKLPLIKQLKNQFSAILKTLNEDENNSNKENLPFVNITNRTYKNCNSNLLGKLLKKAGFKNESGSIFKFEGAMESLTQATQIIERLDK